MFNEGMIELYQPRHTLIGRDGITDRKSVV